MTAPRIIDGSGWVLPYLYCTFLSVPIVLYTRLLRYSQNLLLFHGYAILWRGSLYLANVRFCTRRRSRDVRRHN